MLDEMEDRVRNTFAETAAEITPSAVPPLRLPRKRFAGTGLFRRSPWWPRFAPIAAAVAVAAVVAGSLAVTGALTGPPPTLPAAAGPPTAPSGVPAYLVSLTGGYPQMHKRAVVAATATGKVLATVTPPKPYGAFTWVAAAADDQSFVLAAQRWVWPPGAQSGSGPTQYFRLVLGRDGTQASLTPLPIPRVRGFISGIALSPDGTKLAVAMHGSHDVDPKIKVFTLATGRARQWVWPGSGWIGNNKPWGQPLSWAADNRTLAFQLHPFSNGAAQVRLLDTAAPGSSLRQATLALRIQGTDTSQAVGNLLLTPDGTRIVAATMTQRVTGQRPTSSSPATPSPQPTASTSPATAAQSVTTNLAITEFSARTQRAVRVLHRSRGTVTSPSSRSRGPAPVPPEMVLWTDATGRTLIVAGPPGAHITGKVVIGVLRGNSFTPFPAAIQKFSSTDTVW